jgi:hypothetical protein
MATSIPLPSSGQPLDLTYLTTIASSINDLYSLTNSSTFNKSSKIGESSNKQTTSELIFAAKRMQHSLPAIAAKNTSPQVAWDMNSTTFNSPPVVQITVEYTGTGNKSLIPIINSVTTSGVSFQFYSPDGVAGGQIWVHLTAVGY